MIKLPKNVIGITADSRKVKKDFAFVAIRGETSDGHDFINEAIKKGAKFIVGEKNVEVPKTVSYLKVGDSREALGNLASQFYGNPSSKLKIIGVTGTKGKTTTAHLIYHLLSSAGKKVGLVSSILAKIGDKEVDTGFHVTTPDATALHKFLSQMVKWGYEYAVLEVSSHAIIQKRIAGVTFQVAVLTNIAPEHLDYHKTFEEYKKTKLSFLASARKKVISPKKTSLNVLPGEFNNINAETAVTVAGLFGIDQKRAVASLNFFKLPQGRMEEVQTEGSIVRVLVPTPRTFTPNLDIIAAITSISLILGTFVRVEGVSAKMVAARSLSAEFLFPAKVTSPESFLPPFI